MTGFPLDWRAPLVLSALVLVPALIAFLVWAQRRRRAALARFAAENLLPALVPDLDDRRRTWRAAAIVAALTLLVVALAGPMWGFRWEEVRREGVDLIVAIDTSRSMLATDVKPSRLARAKLAVRDLLGELHGDRIGLVAFAGSAFVQCPLTLDYGALTQSLDAIDVGIIPKGGTALAEAIDTSLEAFDGREGKHQAIILITDGEDHEGKVKEATARATERGVKVFTVGLGTTEGELIPGEGSGYLKDRSGQVVKSRLDEETLKQIAVDTGAVYLHATGASLALGDLYRDYIATMEKRELASTLEKRYEHRFQIPLALVVLLLIVEAFVGDRRTTRLRWPRWRRRTTAAPTATDAAPAGRAAAAAILVALLSVAWLDPHAHTREANQLYAAGKYDDAVAAYNEGLVDNPDSNLLHFNLGDAEYKRGKYDEALAAFEQVHPTDGDQGAATRAAYNAGNATYRKAEALAASDPQKALAGYTAALVAYRRAIVADPADADAKVNYELVLQKRAELQKKLDEQRQQQEQQQQGGDQQKNDQQQQQQADQQKQDEQQQQQQQQQGGEQQNADQQQKPDEQKNEQKADEQQQQQQKGEQQQAGAAQPTPGTEQQHAQGGAGEQKRDEQAAESAGDATTGEKRDGEMTKQEATALLDAQRGQEVQPGDVVRRLQGAVVAEPAQDW